MPAWSPFTDGLQLDLVLEQVVRRRLAGDQYAGPAPAIPAGANGLQIFPGSVPIYRGAQLVGAVGVSGDGIDQDDMVAFLGLANAGGCARHRHCERTRGAARRSIAVPGGQLRYVNCPVAPFLDTTATNVCNGI